MVTRRGRDFRPRTRLHNRVLRVRRGRKAVVVTTALLAVAVAAGVFVVRGSQRPTSSVTPPAQVFSTWWSDALGGDQARTDQTWASLNDLSRSDLGGDAKAVADLAKKVTVADLTGSGRADFTTYWPDPATATKPCTAVNVLSSSPIRIPSNDGQLRAKALVAFSGSCDASSVDLAGGFSTTYVYAHKTRFGWSPAREWQLPGSTTTTTGAATAQLNDWELRALSPCGAERNTRFRVRIMVAEAWEVMCADAAKAGVKLEVTEAYRTPADQAALFDEAVRQYGSQDKARRYVAFAAAGVCTSRHCAGLALDIADGSGRSWLSAAVGCAINDHAQLNLANCPADATRIRRLQRYGFTVPSSRNPGHIEFTLPIPDPAHEVGADCAPSGESTPMAVAAVFRCRLQTAGLPSDTIRRVVAEAVTISKCESGWNPSARAFGGRYATQPHPTLGRTLTEQGLFMIPVELAAGWVPGGKAKLSDVTANAHAAASIWLAQRSWASFGCAVGKGVGAGTGPVLPTYGGPQLPTWAYEY